jgi:hypothetical protein
VDLQASPELLPVSPFKGLLGEPGASLVKPRDGGFEFIGLLLVWQKLYLQRQFHRRA